MTFERLAAIDRSIQAVPAQYEMTAFLAYRQGYKEAREAADRKSSVTQAAQSGGALVAMFPGGRITI